MVEVKSGKPLVKRLLSPRHRDRLRFFWHWIVETERTFRKHIVRFFAMGSVDGFLVYLKCRSNAFPFLYYVKSGQRIYISPNKTLGNVSRKGVSVKLKANPKIFGRPLIWYQQRKPKWIRQYFVSEINDVVLTDFGRVFDKKGGSLVSLWHRRDYKFRHLTTNLINGVRISSMQTPKIEVFDRVIMLAQNTAMIYGHFLVEVLPRLALAKEVGLRDSIIYINLHHSVYKSALSYLNIDAANLVDANKQPVISAHRAVVPVFHHASDGILPAFGVRILRTLKCAVLAKIEGGREVVTRLYVSRAKCAGRGIFNEPAVLSLLEPLGFKVVYPESYSFEEQVFLFSNAECVVGEHGSGMFNSVFCNSGAIVIDLFPASVNTNLYRALLPLGINYHAVLSPEGSMVRWNMAKSFSVNIIEFAAALKSLGITNITP
jgi:capsular polysaccharide biosynthesis protein